MFKKRWFLILPLLFVTFQANAQSFKEGVEYVKIDEPVKTSHPDKVVVTEVFWYGCPHCFRFEPYIEQWKSRMPEGVVFESVPSVLNPSWMEHARAFFALEAMGESEKVHKPLFNAIHLKNQRLNSLDTLAAFVGALGVDEKAFRDHFHSFPVDTQVRKVKQQERKYGHRGVPAVIINGKYRTSGSQAGSNARIIEVIDYLVSKELAAKQ
jgi:thiol:disulfide interchange protein DsbA